MTTTAESSSGDTTTAAADAPQSAMVASEISVDAKMAYDYNGYYYSSSGNVEEYQSWMVTRPLFYGSNSQKINVLLSTSNKWTVL